MKQTNENVEYKSETVKAKRDLRMFNCVECGNSIKLAGYPDEPCGLCDSMEWYGDNGSMYTTDFIVKLTPVSKVENALNEYESAASGSV